LLQIRLILLQKKGILICTLVEYSSTTDHRYQPLNDDEGEQRSTQPAMQSSISVKLPRFVSFQSRLRARTITSCSWQRYPEFVVLQPEYDNPRYSNRDRQSSSLNNNRRPFRIRTSEQQTQRTLPRRIHSTLASKSFWRGLHQAVRQGNGSLAEEIAEQVLQDYYRLTTLSSTPSSDTIDPFHPHNDNLPPLLDSQIFSLVLQA
jgi:hypothetical protein